MTGYLAKSEHGLRPRLLAADGDQAIEFEVTDGRSQRRLPGWHKVMAAGALALLAASCAATDNSVRDEQVQEVVWPSPPDPARIKFVASISSKEDLGAKKNTGLADILLGRRSREGSVLNKPYGVNADSRGRIFVADTALAHLPVFDLEARTITYWGTSGEGNLRKPIGVTSDSQDRVYVTDVLDQRVVVFDSEGEFVMAMGGEGILKTPAGIAVDDVRGRIYVADTRQHEIAVFNMEGARTETLGVRGSGLGELNFPTNLALGPDGTLYISDSMNFRIQIFSPEGEALGAFGQIGDGLGQLSRPKGIGIDSDGHIYVVDASFNNFQIFDKEGQLLLFVGGAGIGPGEFQLPAGMFIDAQDRIYIADQFNRRIQVFQYISVPDEVYEQPATEE